MQWSRQVRVHACQRVTDVETETLQDQHRHDSNERQTQRVFNQSNLGLPPLIPAAHMPPTWLPQARMGGTHCKIYTTTC